MLSPHLTNNRLLHHYYCSPLLHLPLRRPRLRRLLPSALVFEGIEAANTTMMLTEHSEEKEKIIRG